MTKTFLKNNPLCIKRTENMLIGRIIVLIILSVLLFSCNLYAQKVRGFFRDYEGALNASRENSQIMMIDFYTRRCFPSKQIDQEVYHAREFLPWTSRIVCVKVDGETKKGRKLTEQFHITGYPTVLFVDASGKELERITSYVPLSYFIETLNRIIRGNSITSLESRFTGETRYGDLYQLSLYYARNVFDKDKLDRYFTAFKKMDPGFSKDSTRVLTRYILQKEIREGIYSVADEIESFVFEVPQGNSYKLAVLLSKYYQNIGDTKRAWTFFSDYYTIREDKAPIEAYYQKLKQLAEKNH